MAARCEEEAAELGTGVPIAAPQGPATLAGYVSLVGSGGQPADPRCRRLPLVAVGLTVAALFFSAAAVLTAAGRGQHVGEPAGIGGQLGFLEQAWPADGHIHRGVEAAAQGHAWSYECAQEGENCIRSRCCKDQSKQCFAKDRAWAICKPSCSPGIDSTEAPELQTPWSCAWLRPEKQCSDYGENCTKTKCCKDASAQCYYKDPGWAECRPHCVAGAIRKEEPKALQKPWSCVIASKAKDSEAVLALPSVDPDAEQAEAKADASDSDKCIRKYGNCTEGTCCADPSGSEPVGCYKRDSFWSECRESCPHDESWECSIEVTIEGPSLPEHEPLLDATTASPQPSSSAAPGRTSPSLYCFSLMLPWGYEISLIRTQLAKGVGIFACNDWSVISNQSVMLSPGPPVRIETEVMPGSLKCEFGGEYHTALNSEIFFRVWKKVMELGHYRRYDWSVKMDPDAVLLPSRLRRHTDFRNPSDPIYLNNCYEGLHGPIEVVSHGGMQAIANGLEHCRQSLEHEWMTYGEDVWLRRCFGLLAVARVDDYSVLFEKACKPFRDPIPCTADAVSFHPLKTPQDYFMCLGQAMYLETEKQEED
mmetsp:Transcript_131320/g.366082  ORF Transcript_131320/g.366082 Transcript_131320/m.366082 type:complete len:591 (-) Transcript_131320:115-1887(-)